ncbi:MAG: alpha-glucan family phosphorylase [Candidatus Bathyarchaeota archaeon]|nr:alpha-glucan family phosphorylase [Candidatus Bathyarchaeota archaeon]
MQNQTKQKVAYFSMEIALSNDMHTYSGGLGVLAGDTIRSSADLKLPLVGVSLVSKKGYFRQELTPEGKQIEHEDPWDPAKFMQLLPEEVTVQIQSRDVHVKAWLYNVVSQTGGVVPVYFLDTDVDGNSSEDREITSFLYGGDERYRLKQEIVLGTGGVRMLEKLGISIRKYHMNEGHSAFLALELLRQQEMDVEKVRSSCIFTTHTPVEAGQDKFSYDLVKEVLGDHVPLEVLKSIGGEDRLNMTRLALNLSDYINGVAKRHSESSREMFPGYEIHAITNGIHSYTWTCESFRRLYDKYLPGWANEPNLLVRVDLIPDEEVWQAHREAKKLLIDHVNKVANIGMNIDVLTLGFARRATEYKRATLIFSDLQKLRRISRKAPLQIVFAGKAHPKDYQGKRIIEQIFSYTQKLKDDIKIVYLENYDLITAAMVIAGVDVWLNTPHPPFEASGTSGMKAAHNGVVNFSVLDGWWIEGWMEGITGWSIGPPPEERISPEERSSREVDDLYNKLEYIIAPMFYTKRDEWIKTMKNSIGKIAYYFNSHRMMRRYITEAYF